MILSFEHWSPAKKAKLRAFLKALAAEPPEWPTPESLGDDAKGPKGCDDDVPDDPAPAFVEPSALSDAALGAVLLKAADVADAVSAPYIRAAAQRLFGRSRFHAFDEKATLEQLLAYLTDIVGGPYG